jgi:predicted nucleotidyltransferase
MNACGVVVEYNPFHNGHYYHLQEARKQTGAECMIACMSGNYLQRGEPAIVSKWTRTKMALSGGADIVIELPYPFATSNAEYFAFGSISLLEAIGAKTFCFGSESGNIDDFITAVKVFQSSRQQLDCKISDFMGKGYSYPKASSMSFADIGGLTLDLSTPNNILGFEYVKAAVLNGYSIQPETIQRKNAQYHDEELGSGQIASATAIRKAIFSDSSTHTSDYLPEPSYSFLADDSGLWKKMNWEMLYPFFKYKVLTFTREKLSAYYQVEEGLENRIKECVLRAETFNDYMTALKTKRYTWTRLQRASLHIFADAMKEEMKSALKSPPPYLRILGMTNAGQRYLSHYKKKTPLPFVTTLSKFSHPMLDLEHRTSAAYYHIAKNSAEAAAFNEFAQPPILFDERERCFI